MDRLFSAIKKEFLYLVRDIPGLLVLFIMPLLLVLVVTLAQETATGGGKQTSLLVIDEAKTDLSRTILRDLDSSAMFSVTHTQDIHLVNTSGSRITLYLYPKDSAISLFMDPSVNGSYRSSLTTTLNFIIRGAEAKQAMEGTLNQFFRSSDTVMKTMVRSRLIASIESMPPVIIQNSPSEKAELRPSIIQNNVPGFILFAMFFIVIPLSASMIVEKNEGSFMRLKVLPVTWFTLLSSKVVVYLVVCLVQFFLMIFMGVWGFNALFGMQPLAIGTNWGAILVITIAASLAAVGFGILAGSIAKTVAQAALTGSILVVLLGLISGTFLPVYLLPGWIQAISLVSPIRWGIDAYLHVFVLGEGLSAVLPDLFLLVLFFSLAMMISIFIFARRK
jgi:ABC-2 type transport system permease protein